MLDWPASTQRSPTNTGPTDVVTVPLSGPALTLQVIVVGTTDGHADQLAVDQLDPLVRHVHAGDARVEQLGLEIVVKDDGDLGLAVGVALIDPRGHRLLELDRRRMPYAGRRTEPDASGEPIEASPKAANITKPIRGEQYLDRDMAGSTPWCEATDHTIASTVRPIGSITFSIVLAATERRKGLAARPGTSPAQPGNRFRAGENLEGQVLPFVEATSCPDLAPSAARAAPRPTAPVHLGVPGQQTGRHSACEHIV